MKPRRTKKVQQPQKGWKKVQLIAISDPRVDQKELKEGQQPKLVPFTDLLDYDDIRWIDWNDGDGPQRVGGVPEPVAVPKVTDENGT